MSLDEYSAEEHAKVVAAAESYCNAYTNAYKVTILLSDLVLWPTLPIDLALMRDNDAVLSELHREGPAGLGR